MFSDVNDEKSALSALKWCGSNPSPRMVEPLIRRCFEFWSRRNEPLPSSLHRLLSIFAHSSSTCHHLVREQFFEELSDNINSSHHESLHFVSELLTDYTPSPTFLRRLHQSLERVWFGKRRGISVNDDYVRDAWHHLTIKCTTVALNILSDILLNPSYVYEEHTHIYHQLTIQFAYLLKLSADLSDPSLNVDRLKSCICKHDIQFHTSDLIQLCNNNIANLVAHDNPVELWKLFKCISQHARGRCDDDTVLRSSPSTVFDNTDQECHQTIADIIAFICLNLTTRVEIQIQQKYRHLFNVHSPSDDEYMGLFTHLIAWVD